MGLRNGGREKIDEARLERRLDVILNVFREQARLSIEAQKRLLNLIDSCACPLSLPSELEEHDRFTRDRGEAYNARIFGRQKNPGYEAELGSARAEELETENGEAEKALDDLVKKYAALEAENRALSANLEEALGYKNKCGELGRRLEQAERGATQAEQEARAAEERARRLEASLKLAEDRLEEARGRLLKNQQKLFSLQEFLENLPAQARQLTAPYINTGAIDVFLAQCGQFNRINQLWEVCGKVVAAGEEHRHMADFLREIISIYNLTAGDSPAALVEPAPGDPYKNECHFRVRSDGTRVRELLLPGLRNPGGKILQRALVILE